MWMTAHPEITLIRAWMCEVWKGMELARNNNFSFAKRKKNYIITLLFYLL